MPDSLQWIQDTPVWNTGHSNRMNSQSTKSCKLSTDTVVHSRHSRTSNSRTPIMCQTWHYGTQLCSQPPEEVCVAEETHNRTWKCQQRSMRPQTTPQHQRRPHQGISRQIQRNWLFPRNISHHPIE